MVEAFVSVLTRALLPGVLWENRMNSLVAAMVGLMRAGRTNMWEMGVMAPGPATEVNKGKRIYRLFNNANINLDEICKVLLRVLTVLASDVILAIDWTEFGSWKILKAAIVTRGRGIPVYWKAVKDGSRRMAEVELEFCDKLLEFLPPGKQLLIIGDRGFDSADLVRFFKERSIKFVLRFANHISIRRKGGDFVPVGDIPLLVGELVDYGRVDYTKGSAVPARVVRTWKSGQDEGWNLVTNLGKKALARLIVKIYGRRFTIEELFRDYKGGSWQLARTAVKTVEAMERLILILALTHIALVTVGRWARKSGLDGRFRSDDGLSLFTLGERVINAADRGNLRLPSAPDFELQFSQLPITLDEILQIPWAKKRRAPSSPKVEMPRDRLKAYLHAMELTQLDAVKIIGCQQSSISNVVSGKRPMPPAWLPKLLKHANMTRQEFMTLPAPSARQIPEHTSQPQLPPEKLRAYMESQNLRQIDVASLVKSNQSTVSNVVSGRRPMPHEWLSLLLQHAKMSEEEFLALPVPPTPLAKPRNKKTLPPTPPEEDTSVSTTREALRVLWRTHKQKELAEVLGVRQPDISTALSGKRNCPAKWVPLLCEAYGLTEGEFLALGQRSRAA